MSMIVMLKLTLVPALMAAVTLAGRRWGPAVAGWLALGLNVHAGEVTYGAVAEAFDWVHTIDRLKIAERLSEQRPPHLPPLRLCLQVNISGEASKSGLAVDEVLAVARSVAALPRVRLLFARCSPPRTIIWPS